MRMTVLVALLFVAGCASDPGGELTGRYGKNPNDVAPTRHLPDRERDQTGRFSEILNTFSTVLPQFNAGEVLFILNDAEYADVQEDEQPWVQPILDNDIEAIVRDTQEEVERENQGL